MSLISNEISDDTCSDQGDEFGLTNPCDTTKESFMDSKIMDLAFINLLVICFLVLTGLGILNVVKGRFFN